MYDRSPLHLACENLKYEEVLEIFEYCEKHNIDLHNIKNDIGQNSYTLSGSKITKHQINQLIEHKDYLLDNNTILELKFEDNIIELKQKINNYYEEQKKLLLDFF